MNAPLHGLVLTGGASKRMQSDKAALVYQSRPQLELAFELLQRFCIGVWLSVRRDQANEPSRARFPQIADEGESFGPLAGIAAAQHASASAAWLVLACDLPFLTSDVLRSLVDGRDPLANATAFRSARDGSPEPLCAIWEPTSHAAVDEAIAAGKHCPRRLLMQMKTVLLDVPQTGALDNINTPAERESALRELLNTRKTG